MSRSPETTHGFLTEGWEGKFSVVDHAPHIGAPKEKKVVFQLSDQTRNRSGQHGFEIDTAQRVIGHEPYRYVGAALTDHDDVEHFATIMGLPTPVPNLHVLAENMSQIGKAFLEHINSGANDLLANQNIWTDVKTILDASKTQHGASVAD